MTLSAYLPRWMRPRYEPDTRHHVTECRMTWGELNLGRLWNIGLSFKLYQKSRSWMLHIAFPGVSAYIYPDRPDHDEPSREWELKLDFTNDCIWVRWGTLKQDDWTSSSKKKEYLMLRLPWHGQHIYSRVLTLDQTKIVFESRSRVWFWQQSRRKEREQRAARGLPDRYFDEMDRETAVEQANSTQVPYRYVLKRGEVQDRVATIHMDERAWGWLWLPLPFHRRRSVDFRFNEEVGEQTGSWKGGVLGSGIELLPSEWNRPDGYLLAFRRMEAERKF